MKYSNTIEYNISTKLDNSGLTKLQAQLKQVENSMQQMANKKWLDPSQVIESREQLSKLGEALNKSYNSSLGMLDFSKLRTELINTGVSAESLQTTFRLSGVEGQNALASLAKELVNFNAGIEKSSSSIDKIFTTFSNTFRWGVVSSFFSQFMNAIHSSVDYVKELDDSLTQIMLVTDYNRDSMNEYAKSANEAAKALSMSTTGMTNASLVFAQQGYDLNQSQELATLSAKLANASQQDTATTSDQITAYMNAYGLQNSMEELTQQMDNWALIANVSAADVSELAQASQRAASMANTVGVSGEQLAAQIATIESVTREAPEQIGNGLKTLYARFSDISQGGEDEDGIKLGDVTSQLNAIGVQVLDQFGNIRDIGDIMEDLMVVWDDLDQTSKIAAAQSLAGKYQVNRFVSLMDNSDMYKEYLGATGSSAAGTLDQMNQEYAESLAGRTQKLNTTLEGLFNDVFTTDMVYPLIDGLTELANAIDVLFKSIGSGPNIILGLAVAFSQLFEKNLAHNINNWIDNAQITEKRQRNVEEFGDTMRAVGLDKSVYGDKFNQIEELVGKGVFNNKEDYEALTKYMYDYIDSTAAVEAANKKLEESYLSLSTIFSSLTNDEDNIFKTDENGKKEFNIENALTNLQGLSEADWDRFKSIDWDRSKKGVSELTKSISNLQSQFTLMNDDNYDLLKPKILDSLEKAYDDLNILQEQTLISKETFEDFSKVLDNAFDTLDENGEIGEAKVNIEKLAAVVAVLAKNIHEIDPDTLNKARLGKNAEDLAGKETDLTSLLESKQLRSEANLDDFIASKERELDVTKVLQFTESLGQLAFAWQSIQNLGQILTDDSLGPIEKFAQILTGIGIIIPTVITSIKAMSDGIKMLQEAHTLENIALTANHVLEIAGLKIKQKNIIQNIENATSMKAEMIATAELAATNTALATAETAAGTAATKLAEGLASIWAALGPIGIAIIGLTAVLGGSALKYLWDEAKEADAQQKAFNELADQTAETVDKINETAPALNELYDAYKQTGEASDEFKQNLESQAELLGINDAALLISQGKYEDLKAKIDEATEAIYNNNAALQQAKLDKINPNEMVNELTDDQKERYNVTYHQEEGITGITGGTATKGQVNKLDQTPYELVKAAQQDIETQQEKINSLTQKRNDLVKEGLTATGEASQKIASDITKVDEELAIAAQKLAESKEFTENHSDVLEGAEAIRDNALNQELNNSDSIFKTGTYEEIKDFISAQQGVDSSNINELIQKYADLTGNIDAATEATLKLRDQQIRNNELITDDQTGINYRAGEKGKFLIDEIGKQQDWSNEDKAKISNMIDWSDPDVDQKVIELLERIQQGLNDGLSLDEALKIEDPEDVKAAIAEMKPRDSDLEEGPYKEMAEYLREFAGELEGIPEQVGQNSEMLQDFTEAILRYDDAIHDADENLSDWKDLLLNTADAAEDDAVYLEDLMEAFEGMRDMIGDLLDMDVSDLSQQFMQNSDVLDILDKAIYGVGEEADLAYDQLNYLAQLDMAGLIDWTDGIDDELAAWDNALPSLEANMDSLSTTAAGLGDDASYAMGIVQDILGGSIPGPDLDLSAFVTGLEQMVNKGKMSVAQAMAAIDGAGYSAEIVQGESEGTNEEGHINATPHLTEGVTLNNQITGTVSGGGGTGLSALKSALGADLGGTQTVSWQGQVQGVEWTMEDAKQETSTTANATGVIYKANKGGGSGAGQIHFKNVKAKPSGSTKRNTSGNGNHSRPSSGGRGGGGGKSCFVAGTLISTSFGFKPIEQIQKKDIVLSYNKQLGLNEYSEVLQTMIHDTIEPIYTLYIKDEQLRVTGIHRFLVIDKIIHGVPKWVHAADLKVGDWVLFADGTWHVIHKIEINIEHQIVYNFEVSGNHNYYVGRNQILAHNKGGKGKGGKGSGGGGKAKTIEPKEKKEHKKDYYEEVNTQLDKTEKILSKIEKEEDRLIGDKARANQNKQLSLLKKEIDLNKEKQKIQQQELKDVDKLMKKRAKEARELAAKNGITAIIPSPIYDKDGAIANYEEMSAAIDKIHNQFIDQYNAAAKAGNEELTKEIQKTLDKFDKYGDDLLKNAQRHDKLQSEIEETINTLEELEDSMEDIRIDAYTASQEALDNLKDIKESAAELDKLFRDFDDDPLSMNRWSVDDTPYGDLIESLSKLDNIYGVTADKAKSFYDELIAEKKAALAATTDKDEQDAISRAINFFEEQKARLSDTDSLSNGLLGLSQQDLERLQGWMENPEAADNPFGKNTSALFDAYQDAYKRTLDLFEDYRETIKDTRDFILDIYDEAQDSIERQMDQYDRLIEKVERVSDSYTLYYGEDSYDQLDKFYARQGDIMQNQLDKLTKAYEYWQDQYKKALALGDETLIKEIQDKMDEAEDTMLDAAQDLADLWVEKFENAVEASSQHIYRDLFGSNDIDDLTDNWELQKDYMDRYKDDVEKAYEIDKLRSKYLDLLDEAQGSSAQTQNRIRQQMQEQLDLLQNQTTVSEYDVKLANAKLEILQKQMALEDAQRNKNKMQLRRDTQGNYRYVYTADQGDVRQSQQDLEDSEYDAYEMTKEETVNNNDRAINMLQDYIEKRAAIWNKYKDDSTARAKALADLETEYSKIFDNLAEDFTDTSEGMSDILNWLVQNGTENTTTAAIDMLNNLYDENGKIKDQTGQDWMDLASLIQDQVLPGIEDSVNKADLEMINRADELKDSMTGPDGALTKIGSGADNIEDSMTKAASATSDLATATKELFTALGADDGELQAALDKLAEYEKQLQNTQSSTSQLSTQLGQANKTIAAKTAEAEHYKTALDFSTGAKQVKTGTVVKLKKGTAVHYSRNNSQTDKQGHYGWSLPYDMWVKFGEIDKGQPNPYSFYATGDSLKQFGPIQNQDKSDNRGGEADTDKRHHQNWWFDQEELQKNVLAAMDTGGYTGDWNESTSLYKNGKIAMLHQKELVLNATDTENILAAVNIMREITDTLKMSANYMSTLKSNTYSVNNTEPIQQRVEISATFPNVSSITDIEQALLNISDQAYIYANKTI